MTAELTPASLSQSAFSVQVPVLTLLNQVTYLSGPGSLSGSIKRELCR